MTSTIQTPHRKSPLPGVFLVGFMGAGKTSVGKALSSSLGWAFEDLDDRVEKREGRSIERIFRESGEAGFRQAEHAALKQLLAELGAPPRIVALGGGAYVQPDNAALLRQARAPTVFLDGPVEELFHRCQQQQLERPLRSDIDEFRRLYQARLVHYQAASLRIETGGKDIESVAREIAAALGL
ncbi:MAG TPA: shikimate kinase [Terriglobales bacterium]|jgi:shikimate kinase